MHLRVNRAHHKIVKLPKELQRKDEREIGRRLGEKDRDWNYGAKQTKRKKKIRSPLWHQVDNAAPAMPDARS